MMIATIYARSIVAHGPLVRWDSRGAGREVRGEMCVARISPLTSLAKPSQHGQRPASRLPFLDQHLKVRVAAHEHIHLAPSRDEAQLAAARHLLTRLDERRDLRNELVGDEDEREFHPFPLHPHRLTLVLEDVLLC